MSSIKSKTYLKVIQLITIIPQNEGIYFVSKKNYPKRLSKIYAKVLLFENKNTNNVNRPNLEAHFLQDPVLLSLQVSSLIWEEFVVGCHEVLAHVTRSYDLN